MREGMGEHGRSVARVHRNAASGSILGVAFLVASTGCGSSDQTPTAPSASTGQLIISVRTVGDQRDPDGYAFALDGEPEITLSIDGEVRIAGLTPGTRSYVIGGIASNCRRTDDPVSGSVTIERDRTARLEVEVFCLRPDPGSLFHTWGGSRRVRVMNALGRVLRELPISADKVAVSPDQERIAYNWNHDIWVADIDGSNPVNLTNNRDS
ncbi:MAG: hypothetical protein R3324_14350, partial [Halobacteriales archaeon]|nr:hypothetical protein [Halobacteriales archaeon]